MRPVSSSASWLQRLRDARSGDTKAIGRLLEDFRPYLLHLARAELDIDLQAKLGGSDLVQDSLLDAHAHFHQFRGNQPDELRAWLRQILLNLLANWRQYFRDAEKRDVGREVPLGSPAGSDAASNWLADESLSPSDNAIRNEEQQLVQQALGRLDEHYRQVIIWRSFERRPFEEIGRLLGRSADAARMLWGRAVEALQREVAAAPRRTSGNPKPNNES